MPFRNSTLFAMALTVMFNAVPAEAGEARVYWCSSEDNVKCVCVDWDVEGGGYIEVRCPPGGNTSGGWLRGNSAGPGWSPTDLVNPNGTWDPNQQFKFPSFLGTTLEPEMATAVTTAKKVALYRLENDPECAALFANNPLNKTPRQILSAISWRDGQYMKDGHGRNICDQGVIFAFTSQEAGHAEVYICPVFDQLDAASQAAVVIHEALHVAGQTEERGSNASGPGNEPSSWQISNLVAKACTTVPTIFNDH